jgi:hypothetical protein
VTKASTELKPGALPLKYPVRWVMMNQIACADVELLNVVRWKHRIAPMINYRTWRAVVQHISHSFTIPASSSRDWAN